MNNLLLRINHLNVAYDGSKILRNVSLEVPPRKVVCLMGRNGVGKTTTLKAVVGLIKPTSGTIELDGISIDQLSTDERARIGIGYVPQGRDIFPNLTVIENLKVGMVIQSRKKTGHLDRVLELFPVFKSMLKRKGGVLSGGQQQQLAIARALLTDPKLLILDEPTEGVQPSIVDEIGETIKTIRANIVDEIGEAIQTIRAEGKVSILLVEQNLEFALSLGDAFYIMQKGEVVANGEIASMTDDTVKKYLLV